MDGQGGAWTARLPWRAPARMPADFQISTTGARLHFPSLPLGSARPMPKDQRPRPVPWQLAHFWNRRPWQEWHLRFPDFPLPLQEKQTNEPVPLPLHAAQAGFRLSRPWPVPSQLPQAGNPRPWQEWHFIPPSNPLPLQAKHANDRVPLPLQLAQDAAPADTGIPSAASPSRNTRLRPTGSEWTRFMMPHFSPRRPIVNPLTRPCGLPNRAHRA